MPSVNRSVGQTRLIRSFAFNVDSSTTENYLYSSTASFRAVKFFVEVLDLDDGRSTAFVCVVTRNPSVISDQLFSKVGDSIAYNFNVLVSGSDVIIRVDNNDSNTIQVSVIRISLS